MGDEKTNIHPTKTEDVEQGTVDDVAFQGIPGTRLLIEHSDAEVVLLPRPSSSPDDPLNWKWRRKYTAQAIVFTWAFMLGAATLSPAVTYVPVMAELGASSSYLNIGAALALLMLGLGNLLFNPLALRFGRRHVYFISTIISAISQIVTATAQTKATFIGGRILLGFGAAPFEQLPALTVDDQFFVHRRGLGLSIYTLAITMGSFLGPVASGFVADDMGWRWVYWFYAIFLFATAALILFGLEETGFARQPHQQETTDIHQPPKPYLAKLKLITSLPSPAPFHHTATSPLYLLTSPLIWWSGIMYGFGVAWLSIMAYESSTIFTLYGFNHFMVWKARRNNGVMEPETRIYSVFFAGPVMGAGLVLYGVGAAQGIHWAGPIVGMGMIGSALPIAAEVALGYVSESYPSLAGEATTAVIVIRNVIGCAMTFAIGPWIESSGLRDTFVAVGLLAFVVFCSGILLILWGKRWRGMGAKRYHAIVAMKG
ncbi:major facilitator superfamily domain-containing protein [Aspergillus pseudodeflectus]|uniref:Major facilitator superfamily domain-containing protein n=1 Tax=Aspergillus pseudodeflectus TaxID=176178 RepID=A0ABR4KU26_9EURO